MGRLRILSTNKTRTRQKQIKFLCCIAMLFCMCVTMNAQGLKTYSGVYTVDDTPGKATYTYKDADDGTRIYEGNFSFSRVFKPNVDYYKIEGKFHNNLKNGLWIFVKKSKLATEQLKVNYSNGLVNGTYEYSKVVRNATEEAFKGTFRNGAPIGTISGKLPEGCTFTGQTDENGLPDGLWKASATNVQYEKWEHGVLQDAYVIENATGDKRNVYYKIKGVIEQMIGYGPSRIEFSWMPRGCKIWHGYIYDKNMADCRITNPNELDEVYQLPETDNGGFSTDEEFIQAKSTIPNILYKLNGTEVDCVIDEHGNVTNIKFTKAPESSAVAKELERCLSLLKFKPATYAGLNVRCKYKFRYEGNESLPNEETISQTDDDIEKFFDVVEQMPSFPGGNQVLMEYLSKNVKYPVVAQENGVQGKVIVRFIVEKDGSISNAEVVRSIDTSLDREALRIVRGMPKWKPGKQSGTEVRTHYAVPITFHLN